jgi:hypothetical protein
MEESRLCIACGYELQGPFEPQINLTQAPSAEDAEGTPLTVVARAWICPGCGLAHWYADDESLAEISAVVSSDEALSAQPDASYERRMQMLRMLRRVRRM